jgi:hypothetical protein
VFYISNFRGRGELTPPHIPTFILNYIIFIYIDVGKSASPHLPTLPTFTPQSGGMWGNVLPTSMLLNLGYITLKVGCGEDPLLSPCLSTLCCGQKVAVYDKCVLASVLEHDFTKVAETVELTVEEH